MSRRRPLTALLSLALVMPCAFSARAQTSGTQAAAPSAAQSSAPAAQDPAAEIAFWNSVKDARNPAEIKAYLAAFPNGTFAALARIRIGELEKSAPVQPARAPEAKAAGAAPAPPPATMIVDANAIKEVQARLYNLNYSLRAFDGQMNDETRAAIREWQRKVNQPATGFITQEQLQILRSARVSETWGAIAYGPRGAATTVWARKTRADAEREALSDCRKKAGGECKVVSAAESACGALGFYTARVRSTQHFGAFAIIRPTLGQATDGALEACKSQSKAPAACGVRTTFCADGSHKR